MNLCSLQQQNFEKQRKKHKREEKSQTKHGFLTHPCLSCNAYTFQFMEQASFFFLVFFFLHTFSLNFETTFSCIKISVNLFQLIFLSFSIFIFICSFYPLLLVYLCNVLKWRKNKYLHLVVEMLHLARANVFLETHY